MQIRYTCTSVFGDKNNYFYLIESFFYFIATTLFLRFIKYTEYELQSWNITLAERNSRSVSIPPRSYFVTVIWILVFVQVAFEIFSCY